MEAGFLNRRIAIECQSELYDEIGQPINAWLPILSVWGNIRHLSGVETIKSDADVSIVKASIRIRYRLGLTAGMRADHLGKIYNIKAVLQDSQHRYTDLVCEVVE